MRDKTGFLWLWGIGCILAIYLGLYIPVLASGIGGFVSEFLMSRGAADSQLLIGRDGVDGGMRDIGQSAIVDTLPATGITPTGGTLQGNVTDLNGFPRTTVYFEWGLTLLYGNTTAPQVVNVLGVYEATINGIPSGTLVHFRAAADADGTLYGIDQTFEVAPVGAAWLWNLLSIVLAAVICVTALAYIGKNPIGMLVSLIIGIIAFYMVQAILAILI